MLLFNETPQVPLLLPPEVNVSRTSVRYPIDCLFIGASVALGALKRLDRREAEERVKAASVRTNVTNLHKPRQLTTAAIKRCYRLIDQRLRRTLAPTLWRCQSNLYADSDEKR